MYTNIKKVIIFIKYSVYLWIVLENELFINKLETVEWDSSMSGSKEQNDEIMNVNGESGLSINIEVSTTVNTPIAKWLTPLMGNLLSLDRFNLRISK